MAVTLKKDLGQGGAYLGDQSFPNDDLPAVLRAMCTGPTGSLCAYQATVATAILNGVVCNGPGKLTGLRTSVGTCGTAGATTVAVLVNGVSKGTLTTDNADADGTKKSLSLDVDLVAGDLVTLTVTAAPTAGADLVASASLQPVIVET